MEILETRSMRDRQYYAMRGEVGDVCLSALPPQANALKDGRVNYVASIHDSQYLFLSRAAFGAIFGREIYPHELMRVTLTGFCHEPSRWTNTGGGVATEPGSVTELPAEAEAGQATQGGLCAAGAGAQATQGEASGESTAGGATGEAA